MGRGKRKSDESEGTKTSKARVLLQCKECCRRTGSKKKAKIADQRREGEEGGMESCQDAGKGSCVDINSNRGKGHGGAINNFYGQGDKNKLPQQGVERGTQGTGNGNW